MRIVERYAFERQGGVVTNTKAKIVLRSVSSSEPMNPTGMHVDYLQKRSYLHPLSPSTIIYLQFLIIEISG
jgi:hypothetical protein